MKRWFARLVCDGYYLLGLFGDRVMVRPIPDAIWHLQIPGAALYQWGMRKSFLVDDRYKFGRWSDVPTVKEGEG